MIARPTPSQREVAAALAAYHANQVRQAEHKAAQALVGVVLATLLGVLAAWLLLSWAECTASGVAMCAAVITPTQTPWHRRCIVWLRQLYIKFLIRSARSDITWLEQDVQAAEAWLDAAPYVIERRKAYLDALQVELISVELDSRSR